MPLICAFFCQQIYVFTVWRWTKFCANASSDCLCTADYRNARTLCRMFLLLCITIFIQILERMLADARLVLPGRAQLNAIGLIVNECDLIYIPDNDIIAWSSFIFGKHSRTGAAVSQSMMSMVEYMIAIGNRYSTHETDGDRCRKLIDEQTARLQMHVLQVSTHWLLFVSKPKHKFRFYTTCILFSLSFSSKITTVRYWFSSSAHRLHRLHLSSNSSHFDIIRKKRRSENIRWNYGRIMDFSKISISNNKSITHMIHYEIHVYNSTFRNRA